MLFESCLNSINLNSVYFEGLNKVSPPSEVNGEIIILIPSIKSSLIKAPSSLGPPCNNILSILNNFFNFSKLNLMSIFSFPQNIYEIPFSLQ